MAVFMDIYGNEAREVIRGRSSETCGPKTVRRGWRVAMPANADRQRFRNEDLVLKVSPAVNRSRWDESRYEAFIDELCGTREYQKDAIRVALRYLLGGEYADLRALARQQLRR